MNRTMKHNGHLIRLVVVAYERNEQTNVFEQAAALVPFERLPKELKVEHTREERLRRNGAQQVITGRVRNGKRLFFTGLQSTGTPNLYRGNDADKSEVLFWFGEDFRTLRVYYFGGYSVNKTLRAGFYRQFVEQMLVS
jgi:hypothetical protein